jgi:malonyl-CoA O-methyltransferase
MNSGQPTGLVGRERLRRFKAGYEEQRMSDGMLPATYQVFYVVVEKPLEN